MPRRARRDIFADAKVILCRWHSDIIFAVYTREANIIRQRRISLHSNTSRRKANITDFPQKGQQKRSRHNVTGSAWLPLLDSNQRHFG